MPVNPFKTFVSNYAQAMHISYSEAKKYLSPADKIILGLATGAVSVITLGLATKPAYTYLVGKFKEKSGDYTKHKNFLETRLNNAHIDVAKKIDNSVKEHESKKVSDEIYIDASDKSKADIIEQLEEAKGKYPLCEKITIIGGKNVTNDVLSHLPSGLTSLTLTGCDKITDKGIALLKEQKSLKTLQIAGLDLLTDKSLKVIGSLKNLKELDLGGCTQLSDKGMEKLNDLKLEKLDISNCENIKSEAYLRFKENPDKNVNTTKTYLDLSPEETITFTEDGLENVIGNTEEIISEDRKNPIKTGKQESKQEKPFDKKDLDEEMTSDMDQFIKEFQEEFSITSEIKIEPKSLSSKKELLPKSLQQLNLKATRLKLPGNVTNDDLKFLVRFKNLQKLDLSNCKNITTDGLENLRKLPKLKILNLSGIRFSSDDDSCWLIISGIQSLKNLILDKTKISKLGQKLLSYRLPDLELTMNRIPKTLQEEIEEGPKSVAQDLKTASEEIKKTVQDTFQHVQEKGGSLFKWVKSKATTIVGNTIEKFTPQVIPLDPSKYDFTQGILILKSGVTNKDMLNFQTMSKKEISKIKTVVFEKNENITDTGLSELKHFSGLNNITLEELASVKGWFLRNIDKWENLSLFLFECPEFSPNIFSLKKSSLKKLVITRCKQFKLDSSKYSLTKEGVLRLKSNITDEDMKLFQTMPKEELEMIKTVVFETNENITDTGLSELKHFSGLNNITLEGLTSVTGSFLMHISEWENKSLTLSECPKFSPKILSLNTSSLKQIVITNCKQF